MKMKSDLIFMQWVYDMYEPFVDKLKEIVESCNLEWDFKWVLYAINCISWMDWNSEFYLFMKYGEAFISELVLLWQDPSK